MILCLFIVVLCNIGGVFNQQQLGGFGEQAQNIYNGFVNAAGLGQFNQNQAQNQNHNQNQNQNHNHNQNQNGNRHKPKPPHASPCKMKFEYVTDGRGWKGVIKLKNIDLSHDTLVEADFLLPFERHVS